MDHPTESRAHLLFLAHRIPFPPNKGDKIRSYHLLLHLAKRYRVHLGAFIDDSADRAYANALDELTESRLLLPLHAGRQRLRALSGLLNRQPLTLPYYSNGKMQRWVDAAIHRHGIERILVFSSAMAQYVTAERLAGTRRVVDFVDVDSDKWRQYARSKRWPARWIYRREAARLAVFEDRVARSADLCSFVSTDEVELFRRITGNTTDRIVAVPNGVDAAYFRPDASLPNPYPAGVEPLVFTGAMDYWANEDAVAWFVREVMPVIRQQYGNAVFYIVGMNPSRGVRDLQGEGVVVTGAVPDVRPYLQHASAVVAPMRIARGIQNKVLEGMAMARPVVTTDKGLEGILADAGAELLVAVDPAGYAVRVCEVLAGRHAGLGDRGRARVLDTYAWEAQLPPIAAALR